MTSETLWTDDGGRMVRETFTDPATGAVACVSDRYEPNTPPPPPPDLDALRVTVSKATTVAQLRGAMLAYLDATT